MMIYKIRDRFKPVDRNPYWKDIDDAHWNSWAWQQQERIEKLDNLKKIIVVSPEEKDAFEKTSELFHMGITPYYASLMDPNDPHCPVRLQSVPSVAELFESPYDLEDPLHEEGDMVVEGVTHRYPDRVLLYTIHNCPVYCRFCTRKRKVANPDSASSRIILEKAFDYIEQHREIRDVVISGGDPLSYSDNHLEYFLSRLRSIDHIEIFRIGTRNPVTLPQRITDGLCEMLAKYQPVFIHTHFNHPKECTREAFDACSKLANAGCVINNQTVLLKGINDTPEIQLELNRKLLMMRVRPYYLYQCDLSKGLSHFRTPIQTGIDIIEALRGWTSGMAVPHFVVDLPGGGGKIPLLPNYVVSRTGKKWILRNYRHNTYEYIEP